MTGETYGELEYKDDVWAIVEFTPYGVQALMLEAGEDSPHSPGDETVFTRDKKGFDVYDEDGEEISSLEVHIENLMDEYKR